jgi:hypothetical protein
MLSLNLKAWIIRIALGLGRLAVAGHEPSDYISSRQRTFGIFGTAIEI